LAISRCLCLRGTAPEERKASIALLPPGSLTVCKTSLESKAAMLAQNCWQHSCTNPTHHHLLLLRLYFQVQIEAHENYIREASEH
jgi:hypothetical protein